MDFQTFPLNELCHAEDIAEHSAHCIDSSDCRYGQADGPDDFIHECDCLVANEE